MPPGFFVGRADLRRSALIGKKKLVGVIKTSLLYVVASVLREAISST
jgi:hypothetical protein